MILVGEKGKFQVVSRVFVAVGSNLGDSVGLVKQAFQSLEELKGVKNFCTSSLYQTKPESAVPQPDFINAVCSFTTSLDPEALFCEMERIEASLGKVSKPKDAPRKIDLDLLFYGERSYRLENLVIPHPRWQERSFVCIPLLDLIDHIEIDGKKVPIQA